MEPDGIAVPAARVAIVDADHRVRQSVTDLLRIAGAEVAGEAGDVRSALALIADTRPDVVLVDPRLPDVEAGDALLHGIRLGWPATRIVVMGWSDPREHPAATNGASYVAKAASPEEFVAAVLDVCAACMSEPPSATPA